MKLINLYFNFKTFILLIVFLSTSFLCFAESTFLIDISEDYLISKDQYDFKEQIISQNIEMIKFFNKQDLIIDVGISKDINRSDKWKGKLYSALVSYTPYFFTKPYISIEKNNDLTSRNNYGVSLIFEKEFNNKFYEIITDFSKNDFINLNIFSYNRYNIEMNQKYFLQSSSFHHTISLSHKDFYNTYRKHHQLTNLYNQLLYSLSLNNNSGLSFSYINTIALTKTKGLLYPYLNLEDEHSYELNAGLISFSKILNSSLIKLTVEYGIKDYLEVIQYDYSKSDYISLLINLDYPITKRIIIYGDSKLISYKPKNNNRFEYTISINLNWKLL
ncbi:MAG: hypothetical protein M0Q94_09095 [Candidatus Cloacimonetes bacterium]|jgi:hypothetical protein|nr:hypothetical protein [Candidatus Cloacimonadota bacterium]